MTHRPAESYLVPAGVFITERFAFDLDQLTNLNDVRKRRRGSDPDFDAQAIALRTAAMTYVKRQGSRQIPDLGSVSARDPEPDRRLSYSPAQAAEVIGISPRAVLKAIHEHRLSASRKAGRWVIEWPDVDEYKTERERRGRR